MPDTTPSAHGMLSLSPELVGQLLPFHFGIDHELRITLSGPSLRHLLPGLKPGTALIEHLELITPRATTTHAELKQLSHTIVIFRDTRDTFKLKGQLVVLTDSPTSELLFVGTPVVQSLQNLQDLGLKLNDFAVHDPTADLLLLLQTQNLMNQDLQQLVTANAREIERRRDVEQQLRRAAEEALASSRAKASFLATMSHEIRTPLNAVLSTLGLVIDQADDCEQLRFLGIAEEASESLLELLNNILDYSKIDAEKLDLELMPFDPHALLESVSALMKPKVEEKKLAFSASMSAHETIAVIGDPGRIRQILLHLVSNAIKYTERGSVAIRCKLSTLESDPNTLLRLHVEVEDSGIGIPAERVGELFNEFTMLDASYSRRYGGTGLGLVICKRLVEMMAGRIGVESQVGSGSRFWFELDLPEGELPVQESEPDATEDGTATVAPCRILLAEDVMVNRMVLKQVLSQAGHRVDEAADGAEAVDAASRFPYDLILMDVSMPGMDGLEATRRIRRLGDTMSAVPIIALTAHAMRGDRETCLAAGMNDYLTKPITRSHLLQGIARWAKPRQTDSTMPAIAAGDSSESLVDRGVLEQLGRDTDPEMVPELLCVFLTDARERLQNLQTAIANENTEVVQAEAHALGSSAGTFGLPSIHDLARSVEAALREGDKRGGLDLAKALIDAMPAAFDALARYADDLSAA